MKQYKIWTLVLLVTSVLCNGCRRDESSYTSLDTIRSANDTANLANKQDTTKAKADTIHPTLPPIAKAIEPNRLASFLPKMAGWNPVGELQKEIQVRDTFNRSRVSQSYEMGAKKVKVQIDDFAYVPYLYVPWTKFSGTFLDDNNDERTETTMLGNYRVAQSMEKKEPHAEITVFPGNRYIVTITEDGAENINEVRKIAESMDLKGLEILQ
jgi:hypothetical protein